MPYCSTRTSSVLPTLPVPAVLTASEPHVCARMPTICKCTRTTRNGSETPTTTTARLSRLDVPSTTTTQLLYGSLRRLALLPSRTVLSTVLTSYSRIRSCRLTTTQLLWLRINTFFAIA